MNQNSIEVVKDMEKKQSRRYDLVDLVAVGGYSLIISLSGMSAGIGLGWLIWGK
jgi:hypothetical protein